jgi:5-methylcytosine-specific restriction protein A
LRAVKFGEGTRTLIKHRSGGRCELCGARAESGQIHHRLPRGMGGSRKDRKKGSCANGLWLHAACHERVERNRETSLHYGWLLLSGQNPTKEPVKLFDGWWLLDVDGQMTKVDAVGQVPLPVPDGRLPGAPAVPVGPDGEAAGVVPG